MTRAWLEPVQVPCAVCGASVRSDLLHARSERLAASVRCVDHDVPSVDLMAVREAHRLEIWDNLVSSNGWRRSIRPLADFQPVARPGWGVECGGAITEAPDAVVAGQPGGLMLLGPTGIGKTSAALSIADAVVRQGVWPGGVRVRREQQLLGDVANALPSEREGLRRTWEARYRLLVIDDLGAWRGRDEAEEEVERLAFWSAVESHPPFVIVTSNIRTPDALRERLGARVFGRVAALCPKAVLVGTRDHRTGRDYGRPHSA